MGVLAGELSPLAYFFGVTESVAHFFTDRPRIRLQQPAISGKFHAADLIAKYFADGWNAPAEFILDEIVRGPARSHNYRQSAGHGFECRQAKTLASIRQYKAIARRVKAGQ